METVVRALEPYVLGREILAAETRCGRVSRDTAGLPDRELPGSRIEALERHGKHIVFVLDRGYLLVHLGMTGKLLIDSQEDAYTRAVVEFTDGHRMLFHDTRRFGRFEWHGTLPERVTALGPDATRVSFAEFWGRLQGRRTRIKALLLDQTFVRGVGNIYADEALFRARVHPLRIANELKRGQAEALHREMQAVLAEAIEAKGSSISDYVDAEGNRGLFQQSHQAYGRDGEPCVRCGAEMKKMVVVQRGTHYCGRCQRAPRG